MNGTNFVFDSCAVIKLLNRQYDLEVLGINVDESQFFTSVIARMELLSKRSMSSDEKRDIIDFLSDLTVAPLDEKIEQIAVEIRRDTSVKLPDCIVAATSIALGATLLTGTATEPLCGEGSPLDDYALLNLSWPGFQAQNIF